MKQLFLVLFLFSLSAFGQHKSVFAAAGAGGGGGNPFSNVKTLKVNGSTQYIDLGNNYDVANSGVSWSLVGWFYSTKSGNYQGLFDKANPSTGTGRGVLWYSPSNSQHIRVQFYASNGDGVDAVSTNSFTGAAWHFFAVTYDGAQHNLAGTKLYIDSNTAEAWQSAISNNLGASDNMATTQPARIGYSQGSASYFGGNLTQYAYFSGHVLTPTEVNTILNGGHPFDLTAFSNLSSWWQLNDQDTANAIDNNGAITGTWVNVSGTDYISSTPSPP